jgi:hypothetical protein
VYRLPFNQLKTIALCLCALSLVASRLHAQTSPHGPLSIACTDCHTTASWNVVTSAMKFDHASTKFALLGQHKAADCLGCHTALKFSGTAQQCYGCHQKDYAAAAMVDHRKAGFSTDCLQCHTNGAESWLVDFDHDKTQFPTRGAHEAVACAQCHANNRFRGTPIKCAECHQKDYDAAKNPDHRVAKFSVDCATCHRALTWQPAVFYPHDNYFPISAGANHSPGRWNTCGDCHSNQSNYAAFECINCHEHSKAKTDSNHQGRHGYSYQSSACYHCHPRGQS